MAFPSPMQQPGFAILFAEGHTIDDLKFRAARYAQLLDTDRWNQDQKDAYAWLSNVFRVPGFKTDVQRELKRYPVRGHEIIVMLGRLFLLDGMQGVRFRVVNITHSDKTSWAARDLATGQDEITINKGHPRWTTMAPGDRWRHFLSLVIHKVIHVYFMRFTHPAFVPLGTSFHHGGFQVVAKVLEQCAEILFSAKLDLMRAMTLIDEHMTLCGINISPEDLAFCFGRKFVYFANIDALFNQGEHIPHLGNELTQIYEPANWSVAQKHWKDDFGDWAALLL